MVIFQQLMFDSLVILLFVMGIAAGVIGHSQALLADGVESLADLVSSLVVWRGITLAELPADESHPYGHGKAEPLAAAVVSTVLVFASLWIAMSAIGEILRPHQSPAAFTLPVLVVVVLIKELMFRMVRRPRTWWPGCVPMHVWQCFRPRPRWL